MTQGAGLTFFVDRSLGRYEVPDVFRSAGHEVVLMSELYPDGEDQEVADDRWIGDVDSMGWVAITKDPSIRYHHTEALARSNLQVFAMPNANLTGQAMAERFAARLPDIVRWIDRHPGPFVACVYPDRVEQRWPVTP